MLTGVFFSSIMHVVAIKAQKIKRKKIKMKEKAWQVWKSCLSLHLHLYFLCLLLFLFFLNTNTSSTSSLKFTKSMNFCTHFHGNWASMRHSTNLLLVWNETSGGHQSHSDSSSAHHGYLHKSSKKSIKQLLWCFNVDQSGAQTEHSCHLENEDFTVTKKPLHQLHFSFSN